MHRIHIYIYIYVIFVLFCIFQQRNGNVLATVLFGV